MKTNNTNKQNITKKKVCIICTNLPDIKITNLIAKILLKKKLAVCINMFPNVHSLYVWNNILSKALEVKMIIKTFTKFKKEIFIEIKKLHPYSIPELLVFKINEVDKSYLSWMNNLII